MQICLHMGRKYMNKMKDTGNSVEYDINHRRQEPQHLNATLAKGDITSQYTDKNNWG